MLAMEKDVAKRKIGELLSLIDTDNLAYITKPTDVKAGDLLAINRLGLRYCKVIEAPKSPYLRGIVQVLIDNTPVKREMDFSKLQKIVAAMDVVTETKNIQLGQTVPGDIIHAATKNPQKVTEGQIIAFFNEQNHQYEYGRVDYHKGGVALICRKKEGKDSRAIAFENLYQLNLNKP